MKKTNLAVTLAVLALSAIPLMAQQVNSGISVHLVTTPTSNYQEEIGQVTQQVLQDSVQNFSLGMQRIKIVNSINEDINSTKKYQNLLKDYNSFLALMDNDSLANMEEKYVNQTIFIAIDDLAQTILNLPEHARPYYIKVMTESKYSFKYTGTIVTLKELFDMSKSALTSSYAINNSSIAKIFDKHETIKENTNHPFWEEFFQGIISGAQTDK